jgi:hypothetical protein
VRGLKLSEEAYLDYIARVRPLTGARIETASPTGLEGEPEPLRQSGSGDNLARQIAPIRIQTAAAH